MPARLRTRLSFANVVSVIALFVAMGGTSIAALTLARNSVKGKHIAPNAMTRKGEGQGRCSLRISRQVSFRVEERANQAPPAPRERPALRGPMVHRARPDRPLPAG